MFSRKDQASSSILQLLVAPRKPRSDLDTHTFTSFKIQQDPLSNMKSSILSFALLASSVVAAPVENAEARGFETMGALSSEMGKRQSISVERDELSWCRPVTVIFARGTVELGNVGSLAGPPFFNALGAAIDFQNVGVQGVPYPATIGGYLAGGDQGGAGTLAALTQQAFSQCPQSQIVLSGYRRVIFD